MHNNLPGSYLIFRPFNINQTIDLNVYLCRRIKNYDFINDRIR